MTPADLDRPLPFRPDKGDFIDGAGMDELPGKRDELVQAIESRPRRVEPQPDGDLGRVEGHGQLVEDVIMVSVLIPHWDDGNQPW